MIYPMTVNFLSNTWCKFVLNIDDARGTQTVAAHVSESFHTWIHVTPHVEPHVKRHVFKCESAIIQHAIRTNSSVGIFT